MNKECTEVQEKQTTFMESLIADIKSTVESPYASDSIKVQRVIKVIQDYGY